MRRLVITWAVTLVCIVIQGIGRAQSIPSGSYQQSCKNIGVRDEVLTANCQDMEGKWEATQLRDYRSCGLSAQLPGGHSQRFLHAVLPGNPRSWRRSGGAVSDRGRKLAQDHFGRL